MDSSEMLVTIGYLLAEMVLVIAVAFCLSRTKWFKEVVNNRLTPVNCIIFIFTFGLLAIAGTYLATDYETSKINLRDLPVMIAGLLGGPIIGIGAGLIGGIERYSEGGVTAVPCMISTVLAGAVAGLVRRHYGKFPKVHVAVVLSFIMIVIHMVLVATISDPADAGADIAEVIALPMAAFAVLGMLLFSFLYFRYMEPKTEE